MSYMDFFIRKEQWFIRNILGEEQFKESKVLKLINLYYDIFQKFRKVFILLEDRINNLTDFDDIVDDNLKNFCKYYCAEFLDLLNF